jgi:hypothetical protein
MSRSCSEYSFSQMEPFFRTLFVDTAMLNPRTKQWIELYPFTYADGSTTPPPPRDEPERNYLSPSARAVGLTLMAVALVFIFLCALWVACHRNHSVVIAAQPALLYTLCLGSIVMALAILARSFDESYGWDQEMLDKACIAGVWFDSMGHMIGFGAVSSPRPLSSGYNYHDSSHSFIAAALRQSTFK